MVNWNKVPLNSGDPTLKLLLKDRYYLLYFNNSKCLAIAKWDNREKYFYNEENGVTTVYYPDYFSYDEINLPRGN